MQGIHFCMTWPLPLLAITQVKSAGTPAYLGVTEIDEFGTYVTFTIFADFRT